MRSVRTSPNLMLVFTAIFWFAIYAYSPVTPSLGAQLGADYAMIGLISGAYGLAQMLLRIPLGIASDRLGRRRPFLMFGALMAVCAGLCTALFASPGSLLLSRAFGGFAAATWVPLTVMYTNMFDDAAIPKAMGRLNAMSSLGQLGANMSGGALAEASGKIAPFWLASGAGGLAIFAALAIREKKKDAGPSRLSVRSLLSGFRDGRLLAISLLSAVLQYVSFATVITFTPLLAEETLGAAPFDLGLLQTFATVGAFLGALSAGHMCARLGRRRVMAGGFLISGLLCAVLPFCGVLPVLYIVQSVISLAAAGANTMLMAGAVEGAPPERRASAMGFYQAVYSLGILLGPVATGLLKNTFEGFAPAFFVTGALAVLAAAPAYAVRSAREKKEGAG